MVDETALKIDLGHTVVFQKENDILQVDGSDHNYTKKDVLEIHNAIREIAGESKALILVNAHHFSSVDQETRDFLSSAEANEHAIAKAFITKSLAQRILINFLIKFQKPPIPTRMFKDAKQAEKWLLRQIQ